MESCLAESQKAFQNFKLLTEMKDFVDFLYYSPDTFMKYKNPKNTELIIPPKFIGTDDLNEMDILMQFEDFFKQIL